MREEADGEYFEYEDERDPRPEDELLLSGGLMMETA